MALLLNIDTAVSEASVSLWNGPQLLAELTHEDQKSHGSFLQTAIKKILEKTNIRLEQLDGVSVIGGPGSYTGLRVGLASAKGLCYTLNKPLIMLNTLEVMTKKLILTLSEPGQVLYAPMIDARRMEVFTAVYDEELHPLMDPGAYLLDDKDFTLRFQNLEKPVYCFGSGMDKWRSSQPLGNFEFSELPSGSLAHNTLAQTCYQQKRFVEVASAAPLYFKSFFTTAKIRNDH